MRRTVALEGFHCVKHALRFAPDLVLEIRVGDRWRAGRPWWQGPWRRREQEQAAADRSLELLVADLRRLEREFRRTEQDTDLSYRTARLQAISLAYDDTLVLCCRLLDVPEPERPPWNPVTRLQIEAELARAGLDW